VSGIGISILETALSEFQLNKKAPALANQTGARKRKLLMGYFPFGGLFPRPPPDGFPVVLGALCGRDVSFLTGSVTIFTRCSIPFLFTSIRLVS